MTEGKEYSIHSPAALSHGGVFAKGKSLEVMWDIREQTTTVEVMIFLLPLIFLKLH